MMPLLQSLPTLPPVPALPVLLFDWVAAGLTGALCYLLLVAVSNYIHFPRLRVAASPPLAPAGHELAAEPRPAVSILIPARNEAAVIGATVSRLLNQRDAPAFELLLLDDNSSDGTGAAALAAAAGDTRLRVLVGAPVPAGWVGKSWACHQLAAAARAERLLFTDADVAWEPDALAATLAEADAGSAGLLSVWPTQEMVTWSERLVVPLMSFALLAYLPVVWVHGFPQKQAAAANGQCLLFRRAAYDACGGHQRVRQSLIEDVALAQNVKAAGFTLRLADGAGLIRTRMYTGWPSVRDGYAKNILAGHLDSPLLLLLSTFFHLGAFVLPWLWLLTGGIAWPWLPLTMLFLGYWARLLTTLTAGQPLRDLIWMPIGVLLMTRIALQALYWRVRFGGVRWKDRTIRPAGQTH
jgi:chlorobactene glucosyltransferase